MLLAHLADVHLGARPYGLDVRESDILDSFSLIVDEILRERVNVVLVAGDLFDRPRPPNRILAFAISQIKRLTEKGVRVIAAHGEHDLPGKRDETPLTLLQDAIEGFYAPLPRTPGSPVHLAMEQVLRVNGLTVAVYPGAKLTPDKSRELARTLLPAFSKVLEREEGPKVLLAHMGLEEVDPWSPAASSSMLPKADYVALGHIHSRILEEKHNPPYAYPGSLEPLNVAEMRGPPKRGGFLVDLSGGEASIQDLLVDVRPFHVAEIQVSGGSPDVRAAVEKILGGLASRKGPRGKPFVYLKMKYDGEAPAAELHRIVASVSNKLGVIAVLGDLERIRASRGKLRPLVRGSHFADPMQILVEEFKLGRDAASMILELKEAIASEDYEHAKGIILRLSERWEVISRWAR
ncbi:MAG: DNA repair exonuclease [Desulfurococcales archaeon]|nr:DNA repair exonuclease [Desulfurococcales archaeon]